MLGNGRITDATPNFILPLQGLSEAEILVGGKQDAI